MSRSASALRVGVIGSHGFNASAWTEALLTAGLAVVQLVRDPVALAPRAAVERRRLDLDQPDGFVQALEGLDVLGLVTPAGPAQVEREIALVRAAHRAGVRRIVKVSVVGAEREQPISLFARSAAEVEKAMRSAPLAWVLLRPVLFMQNLLRQRALIESGTLNDTFDARPVGMIDVADIAAVGAVVAAGGHDGRALTLSGSAALTGEQIAATLSAALGRPVQVRALTPEALHGALLAGGAPPWFANAQRELAMAFADGRADFTAELTDTVSAVTGAAPRTLEQFARAEFGGAPR